MSWFWPLLGDLLDLLAFFWGDFFSISIPWVLVLRSHDVYSFSLVQEQSDYYLFLVLFEGGCWFVFEMMFSYLWPLLRDLFVARLETTNSFTFCRLCYYRGNR